MAAQAHRIETGPVKSGPVLHRGLPVPVMGRPMPAGTGLFVSTTVDIHGRLADRSPLRRLGWTAGSPVSFRVVEGLVVIVTSVFGGSGSVTGQAISDCRARCVTGADSRPAIGSSWWSFTVSTAWRSTRLAVEIMLLAYRQSLRGYPG